MSFSRTLVWLVFALGIAGAHADEARGDESTTVNVRIPGGAQLALRLPDGWTQKTVAETATLVTMSFTDPGKKVNLQVIFRSDSMDTYNKTKAENYVNSLCRVMLGKAVEKAAAVQPFDSNAGYGYAGTVTYTEFANVATPPEGKFRQCTRGMIVTDKMRAVFTINANDSVNSAYKEAVRILSTGMAPR